MQSTTAKLLTDARDEAGKAFGQGVEAVKKHTAMWVMRAVGAESREAMMHASNQTLLGIVTRLMAKPPPARTPVVPLSAEPTKTAAASSPAVAPSPTAGAPAPVAPTATASAPAPAPVAEGVLEAPAAQPHPIVAALRTITGAAAARAAAASAATPAPAASDPAPDPHPHDIAALALLQAKPATLESVQDLVARLGLPQDAQDKVMQELLERDRVWASVVGAQRLTRTRNTGLDASPPPLPLNHSGPARARPAPAPTQPRRGAAR